MNVSAANFLIYHRDKYYRLVWHLANAGIVFQRNDMQLGHLDNRDLDIFFGYSLEVPEFEVELLLYLNKGVKGKYLINAKPQPQFVLLKKGEDPSDYIGNIAHEISRIPGVQAVVPMDLSKYTKIKELIYSTELC